MPAASVADRLARLERALSAHARIHDLVVAFGRDGSDHAAGSLPFGPLCEGLPALFGAERASVWFHDRQRRELVLEAATPAHDDELGSRLSTESTDHPVVRSLRAPGPEWQASSPQDPRPQAPSRKPQLVIPLRGRQRALGVLVVEGLRKVNAAARRETIALAVELSRRLSPAIENRQLFAHVIRQAHQEAAREAHSQKLAALGRFVAGIAHELNNPLQSVLGHLELLRHDRQLPRQLVSDIRLIHREADRAANIVHRLLIFAGSRSAARRRVNANAALSRAVALRTRACREAGIEIVRRLDPRVPRMLGDALLLQQALLNILLNAEQAIAGRNGHETNRPDRIVARTRAERDRIVIEISDTGPGIPPDVLPRIFEPFFTTKEVGQGTGLGLALAYGIIQDHGGSIAAIAPREGGTEFRIELPQGLPRRSGPRPRRRGQ
jgi:signal transduction histidine kinase